MNASKKPPIYLKKEGHVPNPKKSNNFTKTIRKSLENSVGVDKNRRNIEKNQIQIEKGVRKN